MQIYFLCTGNSCRSQIAEGFAKKYAPKDFVIKSAGVEQHGLNPKSVQVMKEIGIDISTQTSDLIDEEVLQTSDYVITLCGDAKDRCPILPPTVTRIHQGFDDPAQAIGSSEEILDSFRETRDSIEKYVKTFIETLK